jgi:hypothetical protein
MTLHCRLPRAMNAFEMTFEGVEYLVIKKASLGVLYEPECAPVEKPAAEVPQAKRKYQRRSTAKPIHQAHPPVVEAGSRPAPMQDAIRRELAKRPLTSAELGDVIGRDKMACIYTALATMRKAGDVTTAPDENGIRKNALTKHAA